MKVGGSDPLSTTMGVGWWSTPLTTRRVSRILVKRPDLTSLWLPQLPQTITCHTKAQHTLRASRQEGRLAEIHLLVQPV